jgi:hypothetical protein
MVIMNVHFREITRVIQPPPCYSARFKHSTNTNWEDHTKLQQILEADLGGAVPADIEHENRKKQVSHSRYWHRNTDEHPPVHLPGSQRSQRMRSPILTDPYPRQIQID